MLIYLLMMGNPTHNVEYCFATSAYFPGSSAAIFGSQNIFFFHCYFRLFYLPKSLQLPIFQIVLTKSLQGENEVTEGGPIKDKGNLDFQCLHTIIF